MRISHRFEPNEARAVDHARPAGEIANSDGAHARRGSDPFVHVTISGHAQALAARAARLEQLRASVQDGSFRIDAHAIAARLVPGDES